MSILPQPAETISDTMTRVSLPVTVSGLTFWGITLPDFVQILTAIYITLLVLEKGYSLYKKYKNKKDESKE